MTEATNPQVVLAFPSLPSGNPLISPPPGALGYIYSRCHLLGCFSSPLLRVGSVLVPARHWVGTGRTGQSEVWGSGGVASPHAPACPLGLVSRIKRAVSHSKDKHITQLVGSQKPRAAEIRTEKKLQIPDASLCGLAGPTLCCPPSPCSQNPSLNKTAQPVPATD